MRPHQAVSASCRHSQSAEQAVKQRRHSTAHGQGRAGQSQPRSCRKLEARHQGLPGGWAGKAPKGTVLTWDHGNSSRGRIFCCLVFSPPSVQLIPSLRFPPHKRSSSGLLLHLSPCPLHEGCPHLMITKLGGKFLSQPL